MRGSDITVLDSFKDDNGRLLVLLIEKNSERFLLANVYAPTQDHPGEQIQLIDLLEQTISNFETQNIIIGGDINICLDPLMDRSRNSSPTDTGAYRDRIGALCDNLFLSDAWRGLNSGRKIFSFRHRQYASRLDYWLASEHMLGPDTESSHVFYRIMQ